jgi:NADH-quinone oxidoreductase subunit M
MRADIERLLVRVERAKPAGDAHLTAGKPAAAPSAHAETPVAEAH